MSFALTPWRSTPPPQWVSNPLWLKARQVPAFDINFTTGSIIDRIGNITPTMTRAGSVKLAWNGSEFQSYAADVPAFQRASDGVLEYLHEPAATNGLPRSGNFGSTGWSLGANLNLQTAVASLGSLTGNRVTRIANTTLNNVAQTATIASAQLTFWVIASGTHEIGLRCQNAFADRGDAVFNLTNGTVRGSAASGLATGVSAAMTLLPGSSGVYICALTMTPQGANVSCNVTPVDSSLGITTHTAASAVLSSITVYHAGIELGPAATSPIVTTGATVTRAADSFQLTGTNFSNWYPTSGEVTVFCEYTPSAGNGTNQFIYTIDNSATATGFDEIRFFHGSTNGRTSAVSRSNVIGFSLLAEVVTAGQLERNVFAVGQNNVTFAGNRFTRLATDTSCDLPVTPNRLSIGARGNATFRALLGLRRFAVFAGRLSDATLDAMVV